MEIIFKIDTNRPMSEKDKFFISFLNNIYNGKKTLDQILDEDQEDNKSEADETSPIDDQPENLEAPASEPSTEKKRVYKSKCCVDCHQTFVPKSGRAERCPSCLQRHKEELIRNQRVRQTERRRAARKMPAPSSATKPKPEPPKTVACRNCHKQYIPEPGDGNLYCPKCLDKLHNRPKLTPLKPSALSLTVEEVMKLPVVDRYKYAYMWSYQERQRALAMKPVYPKPSKEEEEFFKRCATGDFMED